MNYIKSILYRITLRKIAIFLLKGTKSILCMYFFFFNIIAIAIEGEGYINIHRVAMVSIASNFFYLLMYANVFFKIIASAIEGHIKMYRVAML